MRTPSSLEAAVVAFCDEVGRDPLLVQGAGGNVSWKDGDTLFVKASGTWLSEAAQKNIFVPIDLPLTNAAIAVGTFAVPDDAVGDGDLRPSIETLLHALMPQRVVVHLHSVEVIARVIRQAWIEELTECCGDAFRWVAVPYEMPGAELARAVHRGVVDNGAPEVLFLQNHGLVVGADDVDAVRDLLDRVLAAVRSPLRSGPMSVPTSARSHVPVDDEIVQSLAFAPTIDLVRSGWAISPDHVVFLGSEPCIVPTVEEIPGDCELAFVLDTGVYARPGFTTAKHEQLRCYADVLRRQAPDTKLQELPPSAVAALLDWEAEKYRQKMSK